MVLSIIVPVYNTEKYLTKCIDSILNQTLTDLELILVDDGSLDRSGEICDEYAKQDSRVKVIHKENGGLSSARNTGLDIAQGKYIGFVDSDDWIHKDMYYRLYQLAEDKKADIVQCKFKKVEGEQEIEEEQQEQKIEEYTSSEAMRKIYCVDSTSFIVVCNKLCHRRIFEKNRFEIGRIHEDEFIIHKLLYTAYKVVYMSQELYYYRQTPNSITRRTFSIQKMHYISALEERIKFFKEINEEDLIEKTWLRYGNILIYIYYQMRENKQENLSIEKEIKQKYKACYKEIKDNKYANRREKIKFKLFRYIPQVCCGAIKIKDELLKLVK